MVRLTAGAAVLALACGRPDTAPVLPGPLQIKDVAGLSLEIATLDSTLRTPALGSLVALAPLLLTVGSSPAPTSPGRCGPQRDLAAIPSAALAIRSGGALIADTLRGRLYVYDSATRAYHVGALTGGPPDGVRFTLYRVDRDDRYGVPVVPLSAIGWLDLSDSSAGAIHRLRSRVFSGGALVADHGLTIAGSQTADTAVSVGTVGDLHPFTFADSTAILGNKATIIAAMSDAPDGLHLAMQARRTSYDAYDFSDTLGVLFVRGADTIKVEGAIDTYCLLPSVGLMISVNGRPYAQVTNSSQVVPNVTRLDGQPMAQDEAQVILDLMAIQRRIWDWLVASLTPARLLLSP